MIFNNAGDLPPPPPFYFYFSLFLSSSCFNVLYCHYSGQLTDDDAPPLPWSVECVEQIIVAKTEGFVISFSTVTHVFLWSLSFPSTKYYFYLGSIASKIYLICSKYSCHTADNFLTLCISYSSWPIIYMKVKLCRSSYFCLRWFLIFV